MTSENNPQDSKIDSIRIKIGRVQLLDSEGVIQGDVKPELTAREKVVSLYRGMRLNRVFDAKAVALQRTGRLGTFASALGQEAVSVAVALAMHSEDIFIPSFREQGGQLLRGVRVEELLGFWGGDERGSAFSSATGDFPVCIPVGSQYPQAAGVALANKIKADKRVVVVFGGDGSTSKGDFYEALNMAGLWELPVVFVIVNNQWAISTPRKQQTHAATLAQKSLAGGVSGLQVDGNDALAVYQVASDAIAKARDGAGPSLIEALTYRMSDHTTADDASRYRNKEEVTPHQAEDPLVRIRKYLENTQDWQEADDIALTSECTAEVDKGIEKYLSQGAAPATDIFDYLFEDLPVALQNQREAVGAGMSDETVGDAK